MYSIKPGRGPSLFGGIAGIAVAVLGVAWTVGALSMGAPPLFALFGVVFVILAIGGVIYNFYNATARNRMSQLDITAGREEDDPIARALGHSRGKSTDEPTQSSGRRRFEGRYCPFCRAEVRDEFDFCPQCGKDI